MPLSMSPGGTTPLLDGSNNTFFTNEQTATDTQLTQTLPGKLLFKIIFIDKHKKNINLYYYKQLF